MQEEGSFERKTVVYNAEDSRFVVKNPTFSQQYSHMYFRRLTQLDPYLRFYVVDIFCI